MFMMLQKHKLLSLALIASLTMTACGAKKDVMSAPPAPQKTEEEGQPTVSGETETTDGQMGGGLPSPYGDDEDSPNSGPRPPAPLPPNEDSPKRPSPPPYPSPTEVVTPPSRGSNPIPPNYVTNDPKSLENGSTKRLTGGRTSDGFVYTSTSTDELLDYLAQRNSKVNAETRRANIEAASAVEFAQFNVDKMSDDGLFTLKIREGRNLAVYNLSGSVQRNSASTPLRKVRFANGYETTGSREISGMVKCVDFDGGCDNVFARLKVGTSPGSAIFNVIFRKSTSDIYVSLPGQTSANPEYKMIENFVINSIKKTGSPNSIRSVVMSSWEVVHGRSGVNLQILGKNNEFLGFSAPLLAPEAGTGISLPLTRLSSIPESDTDLMGSKEVKLNYANYIGEARLVANNGLGQVRIALKMRKRVNYDPEVIRVTFMRQIKPIVELNDENLK